MFTQAELISTTNSVDVFWLDHNPQEFFIQVGCVVRLVETPDYWRINRVFTTINNLANLPVKHQIGTIVEIN